MPDYGKAAFDLAKQGLRGAGNLYNPSTITEGQFIDGSGSLIANSSYSTTDFINVNSNKLYFCSGIRFLSMFDVNKVVIPNTYLNYGTPRPLTFKTHASCKYIRVSHLTTDMKDSLYNISRVLNPTRWTGSVWTSYGDSITAQNKWQPYVSDQLGLVPSNQGIGGTKVADTTGTDTQAMCRDERINAINVNSNLITFMGGTNDWAQNVPLGTISDTGTDTFYGSVKKTLEKLITKFPTARVVSMSTPYGKYPNRAGWTDTYGLKNNLNLTTGDYGKVIIEVSRLYGVPCIDVYGNAGWNDINIVTYVTNDGAFLHPNDTGGRRIAEIVLPFLKALEPIF